MKNGDVFGEKEFFCDSFPIFTYRSLNFSTVLSIKREVFLEILKMSGNADTEKFHMLKDIAITEGYCEKI